MKTYKHHVTQEKINAFAEASGDKNPLHIDPVYASLTKFGGTIAHGVYLLSLVSKHLAEDYGENGRSPIIFSMSSEFHAPIHVGDTIHIIFYDVIPTRKYRQVDFSIVVEPEEEGSVNENAVTGHVTIR